GGLGLRVAASRPAIALAIHSLGHLRRSAAGPGLVPHAVVVRDDAGPLPARLDRVPGVSAVQPREVVMSNVYELRVGPGDGLMVIRFQSETGGAWRLLSSDNKTWYWVTIRDPEGIPARDYDISISNYQNGYRAYRIDHTVGTTWMLDGND